MTPEYEAGIYNHWSSFNMTEGYKLICCDVVPEWSDCFRCLHRGIRRVDASSVDALPMVGLLQVATLWTLRDLTLPSATISSFSPYSLKSVWLSWAKVTEGNQVLLHQHCVPAASSNVKKGRWRRSLDPGKSLPVFRP